MTWQEREQIFSKEALNIEDIMKLYDVGKSSAMETLNGLKFKQGNKLRLVMPGKIHIQDYFEALSIDNRERYCKLYEKEPEKVMKSKSVILENMDAVNEIFINDSRVDKRDVLIYDDKIRFGRLKLVGFSLIDDVMRISIVGTR